MFSSCYFKIYCFTIKKQQQQIMKLRGKVACNTKKTKLIED